MSTLLDEPSRKFFLKDLQSCTEVDRVATSPAADAGKIKNWNFVFRANSVHFCITWIQGVVVKVSDSIVEKWKKFFRKNVIIFLSFYQIKSFRQSQNMFLAFQTKHLFWILQRTVSFN